MSSTAPVNRPSQPVSRGNGHEFNWLRRRINELLDQSFDQPFSPFLKAGWGEEFAPSVDVNEKKDAYEVRAELPGVKKEDVDVSLQDNVLIIRGEKRTESSEEKEGLRHTECSYGSFYRSIPLGAEVDEKKVKAEYKDGVLKLTLPKTAEGQNRRKKIPLT